MSAVHPFTGEKLTAEVLSDSYLRALQRDDRVLLWLLDKQAAEDPLLTAARDATADEYLLARARGAGRTLLAAAALGLMGCAELPAERAYKVEYPPQPGTSLKVELAGAVDRLQADEALRRRAEELGCLPPITVAVSSIAAKIEDEKTTTSITGTYVCGAPL
jgi:hypothetical protein